MHVGALRGGTAPQALESAGSLQEQLAIRRFASHWHEAVLHFTDDPGSGQTPVQELQIGDMVHRHRRRAAVFGHDFVSVAREPHVRRPKTTTRLLLCASDDTDPGLVRGAAGPALNPRAARG